MHAFSRAFGAVSTTLLSVAAICTMAAAGSGQVRGEVTDMSGGVLPGVTVSAAVAGAPPLASVVTDAAGQYEFTALPDGPIRLSFTLDGFAPSVVEVTVAAGSRATVVERLRLAPMTEEVVVYAKAPPPPMAMIPYVPPARPKIIPIAPALLETICRPSRPALADGPAGVIEAHRHENGRQLYAKGDELLITGGADKGLLAGENYLVTRLYPVNRDARFPEYGEHTAGLIQIVDAGEQTSTGVVVHACNELMRGDVLTAFLPLLASDIAPAGTPSFDEAARILFGDATQLFGAPRRFLVIDRGSDHGLRAGQRMTLFRQKGEGLQRVIVGEAVVIALRSDSSTIRVDRATDAIEFGDFAAPQR